MAEPLRHRQTKEAATDMFYLKPPRHISTLPFSSILACPPHVRFGGNPGNAGSLLMASSHADSSSQTGATNRVARSLADPHRPQRPVRGTTIGGVPFFSA